MPERAVIKPTEAHVFVVEDKVDNFATLLKMLVFSGVRADHCEWKSSGYGVIQFAESRAQQIDLILLDITLPHEDGYDILKRIRAHAQLGQTRVVAVTGTASGL